MNWIDFVIIVLLILGLLRGFTDGFVKEVASLLALILGIWGAIKFSDFTADKLYSWFDMSGQYVGIISFLVTFLIIVVVIHFVGTLADKLIETLALGFFNRILGMVFGVVKSILILSVIFTVLNVLDMKHPFLPKAKIAESKFYNPISDIVPALFPVIGQGNIGHGFDSFKKQHEDSSI